MALVVGNGTVACGMSPIVDAALNSDPIFIDGVSYDGSHDVNDSGEIQIVCGTIDAIDPTVPGADFSSSAFSNQVKTLACNNSVKDSIKCPAYFENTLPVNIFAEKTLQAVESCRVAREKAILACIAYSLTSDEKGTRSQNGILTDVLDARKVLRKKNAKPNVILASVDAYAEMLATAGSKYIPYKNEDMVVNGQIGWYLGQLWIECPIFGQEGQSVKFYDASGTLRTVSVAGISFIMYEAKKLAVVDKLVALRVKDSENFMGSLVQYELDFGSLLKNLSAFYMVSVS